MKSSKDIFSIVNTSIDNAFAYENYNLNFFEYLSKAKYKREDITAFINSNLVSSIIDQIKEIDLYLTDKNFLYLKESYGWMSYDRVNKFKNYLNTIIEDAKRYEQSKKRGRKPGNKNKKNPATSNK